MGKFLKSVDRSKKMSATVKGISRRNQSVVHRAKALTPSDVEANRSRAYTYLEL